jgi:poly(3-hydroxybutyrate) depolymerase
LGKLLAAAILFAAAAAAAVASPQIEKKTLISRNRERVYSLFVPSGVSPERPAPLLVALHGAGEEGAVMVELWKDLAVREGIVLAGPDSLEAPRWASPQDGPLFLHDVVERVRSEHPIDPRRIYLFGYSAGTVFGLQMAALESEYFAAAAFHAGFISADYYSVFDFASRKIPIALSIGTKDPLFPIAGARAMADALKAKGFPFTLVEIPGLKHAYASRSDQINADAWTFLASRKLPGEAKYTTYRDP